MASYGREQRLKLQTLLESIMSELNLLKMDKYGATNVYYRPGPSITLQYPCIIYDKTGSNVNFADDNIPYRIKDYYQITVIDTDPESEISDRLQLERCCKLSSRSVVDNLCHDYFTIYF